MTHEPIQEPIDRPLEPLPVPQWTANTYRFGLWYRMSTQDWSMIDNLFTSWREAMDYAERDQGRKGREYVVLPWGEKPNLNSTKK